MDSNSAWAILRPIEIAVFKKKKTKPNSGIH